MKGLLRERDLPAETMDLALLVERRAGDGIVPHKQRARTL
jgi:hypothetical protein